MTSTDVGTQPGHSAPERSGGLILSVQPWWTAADQAELDLLVQELVSGYFVHRDRCERDPCPHVANAIEAVLSWRRGRVLRSRAAYLRANEDISQWSYMGLGSFSEMADT